mgnify:CR=1 FL=1
MTLHRHDEIRKLIEETRTQARDRGDVDLAMDCSIVLDTGRTQSEIDSALARALNAVQLNVAVEEAPTIVQPLEDVVTRPRAAPLTIADWDLGGES